MKFIIALLLVSSIAQADWSNDNNIYRKQTFDTNFGSQDTFYQNGNSTTFGSDGSTTYQYGDTKIIMENPNNHKSMFDDNE